MITDLICIAFIITGVFYSGFPYEIEEIISKRLKFGRFRIPKPFGCQLCLTFWCTLLYIIIIGAFSFPNMLLCLILALSTSAIEALYRLVFETIETVIIRLNDRLNG